MRLCDLTQYGHVCVCINRKCLQFAHVFVLIGNVYSLPMVLGSGSVSL